MSFWKGLWTVVVWSSLAWYAAMVVVLGVLGTRDLLALLRKVAADEAGAAGRPPS